MATYDDYLKDLKCITEGEIEKHVAPLEKEAERLRPLYKERNARLRNKIAKLQRCISAGNFYTVGLKSDGTVVAVGDNRDGQCNTGNWTNIGPVDLQQVERRREEDKQRQERLKLEKKHRQENWAKQGLCYYCGGQMGGIFTKKCKSCGR